METITGVVLSPKEQQMMDFLYARVFGPALNSATVSASVKTGVNYTRMRMEQRGSADSMRSYFWAVVKGTDKSIRFADMMAAQGLDRFEEVLEDFRRIFTDEWLRS